MNQRALTVLHAGFVAFVVAGCVAPEPYTPEYPTREIREFQNVESHLLRRPVDPDTAVALALKHSTELALLKEDVNLARAQRKAAWQVPDPRLTISYSEGDGAGDSFQTVPGTNAPWFIDTYDIPTGLRIPPDPEPIPETSITRNADHSDWMRARLRIFIPQIRVTRSRIGAANARIKAGLARIRAAEARIITDTQRAYEEVAYRTQDLAATRALANTQEQMLDLIEKRTASGAATAIDVMNVTRRHLSAAADREEAERALETARRTLASLLGTSITSLKLTDKHVPLPSIKAHDLDIRHLERGAVSERADLKALVWEARAAQCDAREASAAAYPSVSFLQASYAKSTAESVRDSNVQWVNDNGEMRVIPSPNVQWSDGDDEEWRIEAAITIPLFSNLTHQDAPAKALYRRATVALSAAWRNALAEVHTALADLKAAEKNLQDYDRESRKHIQRMKDLLKQFEDFGDVPPDESSKIRDSLIQAERVLLRMDYERRKSVINLIEALGTDLNRLPE